MDFQISKLIQRCQTVGLTRVDTVGTFNYFDSLFKFCVQYRFTLTFLDSCTTVFRNLTCPRLTVIYSSSDSTLILTVL